MRKQIREKLLFKTKDEIWNKVHSKLGGKYSYSPLAPKSVIVEVVEGEWKFELANILHRPSLLFQELGTLIDKSQAILSFSNNSIDGFEFLVRTEDFWDKSKKKLFNLHEVQLGHSEFDSRFFFSTNDDEKIKYLFSDLQIQEGMLGEKKFVLGLDKGILTFETGYPIHNINHLKKLYEWLGSLMIFICLLD